MSLRTKKIEPEPALFHEGYGGYTPVRFTGTDYRPKRDRHRLGTKLSKVFEIIKNGREMTYNELYAITHPLGINDDTASRMVRKINETYYMGYHIVFGKNQQKYKTFRCVKI